MSARRPLTCLVRRLRRDEAGTTLVELAICLAIFLLLFFTLLDFGRLGFNWVASQKAVQMAARIAAVRPPACTGVPQTYQVGTATVPYGTMCNSAAGVCHSVNVTCSADLANATANEIWTRVRPLLPFNATPANLRFSYTTPATTDERMGFLGGPLTPVVTVELQNLDFIYVQPLLGLARLAGADTGTAANTLAPLPIPSMSVSLPGEDLALGADG